ncbi:UNVERIFIED_CONTAM: hypothetical protein Sradi_0743100 [Sesamum radiatum]|uniref:Uncharacterized protein n=1 Tax=Sesamum radiatum TaxID=300843 RepID=A0AAW2VTJ4_SESRA
MTQGSVRFPSRIGRDMLENRRNNHLLSRETVSPRLIEARLDLDHLGRGGMPQPRPGGGRGGFDLD